MARGPKGGPARMGVEGIFQMADRPSNLAEDGESWLLLSPPSRGLGEKGGRVWISAERQGDRILVRGYGWMR